MTEITTTTQDVLTAQLNITYGGLQGDLPDLVAFDLSDADLRRIATEALQGGIPGITAQPNADLTDFPIERYPATADLPFNRIVIRPKTEFAQ